MAKPFYQLSISYVYYFTIFFRICLYYLYIFQKYFDSHITVFFSKIIVNIIIIFFMAFYSVLSASTGSFLLAILAGINPEITVSIILILIHLILLMLVRHLKVLFGVVLSYNFEIQILLSNFCMHPSLYF